MRVLIILLLCTLSCSSLETEDTAVVIINKVNGRVDLIIKKLKSSTLVPGTPLTEQVKNHVSNSSVPDDAIGMILDEKLGGLGNETYNALPMHPSALDILKTKVVDPTYDYLMANESREVSFAFMPCYENVASKRPYGISVFVTKMPNAAVTSNAYFVKGYILNPPKAVSDTVPAYIYSTGNVWTANRKNESFEIVGVGGDQSRMERVEMAAKSVHLSDLTTGTEIDEYSKNWTRMLAGTEKYVPGLLLTQKLGGKGDDPYNVVPMDPNAVEAFKTRVEAPILEFFREPSNKNETAIVVVEVIYADYTSTRPVGFLVLCKPPTYAMFIPNQGYSKP